MFKILGAILACVFLVGEICIFFFMCLETISYWWLKVLAIIVEIMIVVFCILALIKALS